MKFYEIIHPTLKIPLYMKDKQVKNRTLIETYRYIDASSTGSSFFFILVFAIPSIHS